MKQRMLIAALLAAAFGLSPAAGQEQAPAPQEAQAQAEPAPAPADAVSQSAEPDPADADATEAAVTEAGAAEASDDAAAAVLRLRAEIDAMLTPEGLVAPSDPQANVEQRKRIAEIAATSNTIAGSNDDNPDLQYVARQNEMRAYHALAQDAAANDRPAEASYRLTQLRNAAQETRHTDNAYAPATGDYWLLVADLTDLNRAAMPLAKRQPEAIRRLAGYLETHPDGQTPETIGTQVRMALVRLYDQAGHNPEACAALAELRDRLDAEDPRLAALADVAATCDRLGKPVAAELTTLAGETWSLADHAGRRVLIHVYADWAPRSTAVFEVLSQSHDALGEAGVDVLSVSVGPTQRTAEQQAWPVATASAKEGGVLDQLGVRGVPWLLVVNEQGELAQVARTPQVVERLLTPPAEAAEDAAEAEAQAEDAALNPDDAGADSP